MKPILSILFAVAIGTLFAEKQPLERYQSIIDRQPFGKPPPGFNPEQMASEVSARDADAAEQQLTQEQEVLQKSVSFSVINVDPDDGGLMVGFSDLADPKVPRHYYMRVGTTRDGWLVKEADIAKKTMTVVKDGVEVSLELGANSNAGGAGAKGKGGTAPASRGGSLTPARGAGGTTGRSGLLARRGLGGTGGASAPGSGLSSFQSRRAQREQAEAQAQADAAAKEAERKRLAEEQAAKEAEERAARENERAEQREQLKAIQDELKRVCEEKERARAAAEAAGEGEGDDGNES